MSTPQSRTMNRRNFLRDIFATAALATGLVKTNLMIDSDEPVAPEELFLYQYQIDTVNWILSRKTIRMNWF
jgi:hypothetical protein